MNPEDLTNKELKAITLDLNEKVNGRIVSYTMRDYFLLEKCLDEVHKRKMKIKVSIYL